MKNIVYCGETWTVPYEENRSYYFYPENGIMPADQVEKTRKIVERHARNGKPYALVTVSPYVLKAVELHTDLLGARQPEYVGPDGEKVGSIQELFSEMYKPFRKMMCGESAPD